MAPPPLSTFSGYLRCLRPEMLNELGRQVLADFFPHFGNTAIEDQLPRLERDMRMGLAPAHQETTLREIQKLRGVGVKVESRRHRRYAGGDGLLPRGCYFSICRDSVGNDGGTLCRELFEYRDKRLPGFLFVGDSTDSHFASQFINGIEFREGYSAIVVLAFPPGERDADEIWVDAHEDTLRLIHGAAVPHAFATLIETRQIEMTVPNVLDMRMPQSQLWIHEKFTRQDAAPYYSKCTPTRPMTFLGMLPTLLSYEYGGTALTHGIGSWLRANGASGLVFPSARSNASVRSTSFAIESFHGWNFVDYRVADHIAPLEGIVDVEPWEAFDGNRSHILVNAESLNIHTASWGVSGIESEYARHRSAVLCLEQQSNG